MRNVLLRLSFLSFVSVALVACGGSTDVNGGGTDDTGGGGSDSAIGDGLGSDTSSSTDGETDSSTATDSSTGGDADAPPVCSSEPTRVACQDCCAVEHKAGRDVFDAALLACACTDGVCKTECAATACGPTPKAPDAACKACLAASVAAPGDAGADASADAAGPDGKCHASVASACSTDAKCVAYLTCLGTCPGG